MSRYEHCVLSALLFCLFLLFYHILFPVHQVLTLEHFLNLLIFKMLQNLTHFSEIQYFDHLDSAQGKKSVIFGVRQLIHMQILTKIEYYHCIVIEKIYLQAFKFLKSALYSLRKLTLSKTCHFLRKLKNLNKMTKNFDFFTSKIMCSSSLIFLGYIKWISKIKKPKNNSFSW